MVNSGLISLPESLPVTMLRAVIMVKIVLIMIEYLQYPFLSRPALTVSTTAC